MSFKLAESRESVWPFLFRAGALGALLAAFFPAFFHVGMGALSSLFDWVHYRGHPGLWDILKSIVLLCPLTMVWYGPFGFLAGSTWAVLAHWRRRKLISVKWLLVGSVLYGLFASFIFPLYDALAQFQPVRDIRYTLPQLPLIAFFCILSSLTGAFVFRKRFVPNRPTTASPPQ